MDNKEWINLPKDKEVFGIVYLIRNNHPESDKKYYIGKKQRLKKIKRKPLKGKKRNRIDWVDNDMDEYWGSSKELLQDIEKYGLEHFTREVIEVCDSKFHMSFAEMEWQVLCKVLFDDRFYNGVINARIGIVPKDYIDIVRNPDTLNL